MLEPIAGCLRRTGWMVGAALLCMLLSAPGLAQPHTLNFKEADIRSLIDTVADITGRNFVIDPEVSGQVTVVSSQPLDEDEVYEVFLSILQVHGYSAIPDGQVTRIVSDVTARQDGQVPIDAAREGGASPVMRILSLEHVRAGEAAQLLRPLLPQSAFVAAHPGSNTLLISARGANVDRIEAIIERLDRESDEEIEVMAMEQANAAEVARIINRLYPPANGGSETAIADERTNTLILNTDPGQRLKVRTLVSQLDAPQEHAGATQVIYLRYAGAEALVPVLESIVDDEEVGDGAGGSDIRIRAHPDTNALVVTAPPAVFRNIQSVVNQLDIRRAQVLVEAIIAEVAVDSSSELGIQWQFFESGDRGFFGGTNYNTGGNNILNLAVGGGSEGRLGGEGNSQVLPGRGLNLGYVAGKSSLLGVEILEIGALLRALASDSNTNVLSTPSIVTLDNQEASINVGQEVPFVTGQYTNQGVSGGEGQVNPFQTINRQEVGIKLTVTPHINEGDMVILDIGQEVSDLLPSAGAVDLITSKRTIDTRVMVPDGDILVLGGLITDDLTEQTERVPGLSRIPLLGKLFQYRSSSKIKRNLMVFIRPRILRDDDLMNNITSSKYSMIRARQLEQRSNRRGITPEEEMPLLPELDDFLQQPPPDGEDL